MKWKADVTTTDDLTCQELVELVTAYLEGTLPADERRRFEAHLVGCSACRTYLEQMRQTIRALHTLTEEAIPPDTQQVLLATFRAWKRR
jgi:anti-sigma factor RsiW